MFENLNFKRPLIIGTGGGNDIVSATLVLADLQKRGISADLAGICSPGAIHIYNGSLEKSINKVSKNTQRFLDAKNRKSISFIDAEMPEAIRNNGIPAKVYNLSGRYGTSKLILGLQKLIEEEKYDGIVAVDVGGDILARAKKDTTILSPLMDFTTLYVVSQLNVPSVLVEFGLQTDGELRPKGCEEILKELKADNMILEETIMYKENLAVQKFRKVYDQVKSIRHGHTAVMTLKTLEELEDIQVDYFLRVRALEKKVIQKVPITLESKYFGKIFTIDLKQLAKNRELAFSYRNNLELYLKTKKIMDTKTEMDTLYYRDADNLMWLGLVCAQITGSERQDLLNYALDNLESHADTALLWKKDAEALNLRLAKKSKVADEFILTSNSEKSLNSAFDKVLEVLK